jgi:hypothetical protein
MCSDFEVRGSSATASVDSAEAGGETVIASSTMSDASMRSQSVLLFRVRVDILITSHAQSPCLPLLKNSADESELNFFREI